MNKKIVNTIVVILTALLIVCLLYLVAQYVQSKRQTQEANPVYSISQPEDETIIQDDFINPPTMLENIQDNKEIATTELTPEEKRRQQIISKLSNDELIILLENIVRMAPQESVSIYGAEYISSLLKEIAIRKNDMTEEQRQKMMKILEKIKPPQINEDE
jgi:hypothetical protein